MCVCVCVCVCVWCCYCRRRRFCPFFVNVLSITVFLFLSFSIKTDQSITLSLCLSLLQTHKRVPTLLHTQSTRRGEGKLRKRDGGVAVGLEGGGWKEVIAGRGGDRAVLAAMD